MIFQESGPLTMRRLLFAVLTAAAVLFLLPIVLLSAEGRSLKKYRRAALPQFSPSDGAGIFFEDVFAQGVSGPRPKEGKPGLLEKPGLDDRQPPGPPLSASPRGGGSCSTSMPSICRSEGIGSPRGMTIGPGQHSTVSPTPG